MASKLTFRGVTIRYIDVRRKDGILLSRLHLTGDLSKPISDEMGWSETLNADGWKAISLAGELQLQEIRLSVPGLKQHDLEIVADEARDFKALCIEEDGVERQELRFLVVSTAHMALIEEYWRAVGEAKAQMMVRLQPEQQQLAEQPAEEKPELLAPAIDQEFAEVEEPEGLLYHCDYCEKGLPLENGSQHRIVRNDEEILVDCQHAHAKLTLVKDEDPTDLGPALASQAETEGAEAREISQND